MRPRFVIMPDEVAEHVPPVSLVDHDDEIHALATARPNETLRDGVRLRRGDRRTCEHGLACHQRLG